MRLNQEYYSFGYIQRWLKEYDTWKLDSVKKNLNKNLNMRYSKVSLYYNFLHNRLAKLILI